MHRMIFMLLAGLLATGSASAQRQFVGVIGIPALEFAALDGVDFDGDNDLDLFVTGMNLQGEPFTGIYRMVERRETPRSNAPPKIDAVYERRSFISRNLMRGTVDWADFTGDGRPDVLATGLSLIEITTTSEELIPISDIYVGGDGTLSFNTASSGLPGVYDSQTAIADINGDGALDVVLAGRTQTGLELGVFYNVNNGSVGFTRSTFPFDGLWATSIDVTDVDGDGRMDVAVAGFDASESPVVRAWRNLGNDQFAELELGVPERFFGSVTFGDVDRDGDQDLLLMGAEPSPTLLSGMVQLFLNDGSGVFTEAPDSFGSLGATPPSLFNGNTIFGDIDGDNDIDIVLSGMTGLQNDEQQSIIIYERIDDILLRTGFTRGILNGTVRLLDYDGNGRKDIVLMGRRSDTIIASILEY